MLKGACFLLHKHQSCNARPQKVAQHDKVLLFQFQHLLFFTSWLSGQYDPGGFYWKFSAGAHCLFYYFLISPENGDAGTFEDPWSINTLLCDWSLCAFICKQWTGLYWLWYAVSFPLMIFFNFVIFYEIAIIHTMEAGCTAPLVLQGLPTVMSWQTAEGYSDYDYYGGVMMTDDPPEEVNHTLQNTHTYDRLVCCFLWHCFFILFRWSSQPPFYKLQMSIFYVRKIISFFLLDWPSMFRIAAASSASHFSTRFEDGSSTAQRAWASPCVIRK